MLRNALRCDLVAALFIGPPRPQWRSHSDHTATTQRPHGDTQGLLGCRSRPAGAIQRATVPEFILVQASANPCKTLQSASICFKAPCKKMQYFAIECFEMLHFVSFTPVHLGPSEMETSVKVPLIANRGAQLSLFRSGRLRTDSPAVLIRIDASTQCEINR
jgi:hypothetical protein